MEKRAVVVRSARAKVLRPGDSGVFRYTHAANLPANVLDASVGDAPRPTSTEQTCGQIKSAARRVTRVEAASAFETACFLSRVSDVEIAAALDEPRQRVADMRSGARPIAMEHLVLLARRLPKLFEVYAKELFG